MYVAAQGGIIWIGWMGKREEGRVGGDGCTRKRMSEIR